MPPTSTSPAASPEPTSHSTPVKIILQDTNDVAELTYDALDESAALRHVRDASAGGTVLFVGTTRDTFQGKRVLRLEYEAYSKLAIKTLESILRRSRSIEWPPPAPLTTSSSSSSLPSISRTQAPDQPIPASQQVTRIFIAHRLGHVPVGEPSILVCASAPHRRRAFEVAEWALEQVKKDVQVWKREVYGASLDSDQVAPDGVWKGNKDVQVV